MFVFVFVLFLLLFLTPLEGKGVCTPLDSTCHVTVDPRYVDSLPKYCVLGCGFKYFGPRLEALTGRVWMCVCVGGGCVCGGVFMAM